MGALKPKSTPVNDALVNVAFGHFTMMIRWRRTALVLLALLIATAACLAWRLVK